MQFNAGQQFNKAINGAPGVPPAWGQQAAWSQQAQGQIVNPYGAGNAVAMANGSVVRSYPTIAAAGPELSQGCPVPATDNVTMVPKTTLVLNQQLVKWFTVRTTQQPVATATNVEVVQHPTICSQLQAPN